VPIDCRAARAELTTAARRLHGQGRRAIVDRARTLTHLARSPSEHIARNRRQLHQMLRELRASARRAGEQGLELARVHLLVLGRSRERAASSEAVRRRRELERLALALAAHDPQRTLARGYALVEDREGDPLTSAAAARAAGEVSIRFHDGAVPARTEP
jgi:exodeoxyribonuclease VII large subunit